MTSMYKHNYRKVYVENANQLLEYKNEELVHLVNNKGETCTYKEAFEERIKSLEYYKTHKYRSDAVLGYEVLTTFSRDDEIDIEVWKKMNVAWLEKTFNVAPDGKPNVKSVVYHADEAGNVHCHAYIIPIDPRGRLNAKHFTGSRKILQDLQNSYAFCMKELGLERGLENGQAKHKDIKKFYAELNHAMLLSEAKKAQSGYEYYLQFMEEIKTEKAARLKRAMEEADSIIRKANKKRIQIEKETKDYCSAQKEEVNTNMNDAQLELLNLKKEIEKMSQKKKELDAQLNQMQEKNIEQKIFASNLQDKIKFSVDYLNDINVTPERIEELEYDSREYRKLLDGIELLREDAPAIAKLIDQYCYIKDDPIQSNDLDYYEDIAL